MSSFAVPPHRSARRASFLRSAVAVLALGSIVACSDKSTEPDDEPNVQRMRIAVGESVVTVDRASGQPSGELVVPAGTSTVSVQWLRSDNSADPAITASEFEFRMTPANTNALSFTTTGPGGGTITTTGLASGATTTAAASLWHKPANHADFGPYTITIRVQ